MNFVFQIQNVNKIWDLNADSLKIIRIQENTLEPNVSPKKLVVCTILKKAQEDKYNWCVHSIHTMIAEAKKTCAVMEMLALDQLLALIATNNNNGIMQ